MTQERATETTRLKKLESERSGSCDEMFEHDQGMVIILYEEVTWWPTFGTFAFGTTVDADEPRP